MFFEPASFPFTAELSAGWRSIRAEVDRLDLTRFEDWPERFLYEDGWKVFGLYAAGQKFHRNCALCPATTRLVEAVPGLMTAGFSRLEPGTHIRPHVGYTGAVLRCHLGLVVPGEDQCRLRVGPVTRSWREGECLVFDDTVAHEAWNDATSHRIVLLLDFLKGSTAVTASGDSATPAAGGASPQRGTEVVVVSGLPRSGTSLLMQMLEAGGMALLSDGRRTADSGNTRGYYEYEPVKHLARGADWLGQARGKVVKIVAPLLPLLPTGEAYRFVLVERDLDQVLASQAAMLSRLGHPEMAGPTRQQRLKQEYERQLRRVKDWITTLPRAQVLYLSHADILSDPLSAARALDRFLGGGLAIDAMAAQVQPALHHHK